MTEALLILEGTNAASRKELMSTIREHRAGRLSSVCIGSRWREYHNIAKTSSLCTIIYINV